jgi:hypothetical protein
MIIHIIQCRWTGNGCTMLIDVPRSSLMAYIIFCMWPRKTSGMVSCAACAEIARRIAPLQGSFTAIFFLVVSCPIIFVGQVTEKKGVLMADNEEEECDENFPGYARFDAFDDDTAMEEPEGEAADDDPTNDLGQALHDAWEDCESEK